MVTYNLELKDPSLCSVRVFRRESQRSPLTTIIVQLLAGELSLSIGMGFQTTDGYGIIIEMSSSGEIIKWREL
jgi:hypothetical protein